MEFVTPSFAPAIPEIFLAIGICVLLVADLFISDKNREATYLLAIVILAATAILTAPIAEFGRTLSFSGSFVVDPLARVLKLIAIA
ncbi:MAG: NADH:ubiquinone oxidoreductase subunit N, partial [Gammaproteobacteria bacterium]